VQVAELQRDLRALSEKTDLQFEAQREASRLERAELARRLDILNGEAERLRQMQATYVPRETYEQQQHVLIGAFITIAVGLFFMLLRYIFKAKD
jgi:uncharacterized secreted protein with C-terminal beta-propeller domain